MKQVVGPTQAWYLMVWLYSVVLMSNMVGVKNKWNDMVECVGIMATSEQWLQLVMYEGRRFEAQIDISR